MGRRVAATGADLASLNGSGDWTEVVVCSASEFVDDLAGLLADELSTPVEIRDREVILWAEPSRAEALAEQARRVAVALAPDVEVVVKTRPGAGEEVWRDAYKRHFRLTRVTDQLVIAPSWEQCDPKPGEHLLHLDPGLAFGTGDHASTRLVLRAIQNLADQRHVVRSFLDVGTGSGILAMACARFWPTSDGLALDNDPVATRTAQENFEENAVTSVAIATATVESVTDHFDLILANIQADVLCAMAADLMERLRTGGVAILAGILDHQAPDVIRAFQTHGADVVRQTRDSADPEWVAIELTIRSR